MKTVKIKSFDVSMEVKTKGIELQINDDDGQIGDLVVTKTGIIWCQGKVSRKNGKKFSWGDLQRA